MGRLGEKPWGLSAISVDLLYRHLTEEYGYPGSYKSVLKYVRTNFPAPAIRPFRRVETPPGAQSQSDWVDIKVKIGPGGEEELLHGFLMVLSHSRREAVVWSRSMDQLSWHWVHNEAFKRLKGVAARMWFNEGLGFGKGAI